ncbi:Calcium/calmodulin-dependent protein kinase type IV [Labeo rohita]|uniref:Calcium/calmodulin-dependent protein kinase type IV n=1 Tax=Labeo rohita TaxID=84645 RepID=A0ABQ8M946_LABRO|nr:Calcium/calmodulin-dependent protein kinase type IV [Labeo rohita]
MCCFRIVERGYYSERDAAHVIKQILEAVAPEDYCVCVGLAEHMSSDGLTVKGFGDVGQSCRHSKANGRYLHENGVVHRDLKPENLLYADLSIDAPLKIADFGLSKIIDEQVTMKTVCGTPGYCAPEILRGNAYGPEVDMWSVGVILYILLCGFEPFFDPRGDQYMYSRILNCDYEFVSPWWDEVSLNAKDLVSKLIVLDPHKRLTVKQALEHPWVLGKAARFSHMDTTQRKLQEFNARRKLKAAMKAVVATSRMHEGSRRRTDSCEMPNADKTSRQSSIQKDNTLDSHRQPIPIKEGSEQVEDGATTEGHRQASVLPKAPVVRPRVPKKSCSVDPGGKHEPSAVSTTPPSPKNLSNGFSMSVEASSSTAECQ